MGRQRGVAGDVWRRVVRGVSHRLRDGILGILYSVHGVAVCVDLSGCVDGIPQQARSPSWRSFWDVSFSLASGLATLLFGVAVGNAMRGMPIGADMEYHGAFRDLLHPYALLVGVFAVATFAMHGSIYLYLKTEGDLQKRIHGWMWRTFGIFLVLYILTTIFTLVAMPLATRISTSTRGYGLSWCSMCWPSPTFRARSSSDGPADAFLSSCATIAALTFLFGVALFPDLIHSSLNPEWSLTVYNAASSHKTLAIMATIAAMGMPFVLAYTSVVYWVFRGKVQLGTLSY